MNKILLFLFVNIHLNSFTQQEVFATVSNGDLYSFDIENCTRTLIGSTGFGFGDIAFTTNNELWGIENGNLYHINKINGNSTFINNTGIFPVSLVGINDSLLFTEYQMNLYSINTNNGDINLIGFIGYSADGDLIWDGKTLFMLTPLVKIEINSSLNQILSASLISNSIPTTEGGVIYGENYYKLVGFKGADIYEICHLNGSYSLLCPNLNLDGTPGAASTFINNEDLNLINVITPNSDGNNDFFQPKTDLDKIESIEIINRWGDKIIVLQYPFIWDGKDVNNKNILEGVYFYFIKIKNNCTTDSLKQGMIQILR